MCIVAWNAEGTSFYKFIFGFILYDILRLASMLRLCRGFGAVRGCHDVKGVAIWTGLGARGARC